MIIYQWSIELYIKKGMPQVRLELTTSAWLRAPTHVQHGEVLLISTAR